MTVYPRSVKDPVKTKKAVGWRNALPLVIGSMLLVAGITTKFWYRGKAELPNVDIPWGALWIYGLILVVVILLFGLSKYKSQPRPIPSVPVDKTAGTAIPSKTDLPVTPVETPPTLYNSVQGLVIICWGVSIFAAVWALVTGHAPQVKILKLTTIALALVHIPELFKGANWKSGAIQNVLGAFLFLGAVVAAVVWLWSRIT